MKIEEPAPEHFLYRLWGDRSLVGRRMHTVDGRTVEVVACGTRNPDAGPDFRGATLIVDGKMCCGDIEIHPVAVDWYRHGHHRDPRYNNVVLHVVTMDVDPEERTLRQDGEEIPVLNLDQFLVKPAEQLAAEGQAPPGPEPVACALREASRPRILHIVELAGDERLNTKCMRYQEERLIDGWDQILYRGLAEALGYAKNQVAFRKLADRLPYAELSRAIRGLDADTAWVRAQAYLFGAAGLLPSEGSLVEADHELRDFLGQLRTEWEHFPYRRKIDPLHREEWLFFRLRPQNFPTRRIAALAALAVRFGEHGFLGGLMRIVQAGQRRIPQVGRQLSASLTVESDPFWRTHYCFDVSGSSPMTGGGKLVGPERAADMVVNVVLPCLMAYARETGDGQLQTLLAQVYVQAPLLAENAIVREMTLRLFGAQGKGVVDTACRQQGLIQLFKMLCQRGPCARCLEHFEVPPAD